MKLIAASLTVASLLCLPAITRATPATFYVNSSLSFLDASGNAFGLNFGPQAAGSMRSYFGGAINTDVSGGVITFLGGGSIVGLGKPRWPVLQRPVSWWPLAGKLRCHRGPDLYSRL